MKKVKTPKLLPLLSGILAFLLAGGSLHAQMPGKIPQKPGLPSTPSGQQQQPMTQKPNIDKLQPPGCVNRNGIVTIQGTAFGAMQGANRVALTAGGPLVLPINNWSDTTITAKVVDDPRLIDGNNYPIGIQNKVGSWISNTDKQIKICPGAKTEKPATPGVTGSTTAPAPRSYPLALRVERFTVTGTGRLAERPPFKPQVVRVEPMLVTGTGRLSERPPFTPKSVRTEAFTVTGTGALR